MVPTAAAATPPVIDYRPPATWSTDMQVCVWIELPLKDSICLNNSDNLDPIPILHQPTTRNRFPT